MAARTKEVYKWVGFYDTVRLLERRLSRTSEGNRMGRCLGSHGAPDRLYYYNNSRVTLSHWLPGGCVTKIHARARRKVGWELTTHNEVPRQVVASTLKQCLTPIISIEDTTLLRRNQGERNSGSLLVDITCNREGVPVKEQPQPFKTKAIRMDLTNANSCGNTLRISDRSDRRSSYAIREAANVVGNKYLYTRVGSTLGAIPVS